MKVTTGKCQHKENVMKTVVKTVRTLRGLGQLEGKKGLFTNFSED